MLRTVGPQVFCRLYFLLPCCLTLERNRPSRFFLGVRHLARPYNIKSALTEVILVYRHNYTQFPNPPLV
jgi:hypothetical protein